jgi:NDP-4-keto-2,6-dideoxyhexose 3-C-methyltransferase
MKCRNCRKKKFSLVAEIGDQPISSYFPQKKTKLKNYSLNLYKCKHCDLIQLYKIHNLQDMYGPQYGYKSGISNLMVKHLKKKFDWIRNLKIIKKKPNILDIGSNDGTFLNFFSKLSGNKKLVGIDPSANAFPKSYNKNIKVIIDFFNIESIDNYFKDIKFSVITSFAMFYDVEDPNTFCKNIYKLLEKNGVWVLEFSYFPLLLKNLTYDQICHEHVMYYTLSTFSKILNQNNLKVVDFSLNEINGGSIEVICAKKSSNLKSKNDKIKDIILQEEKISKEDYDRFNLRVQSSKKNLQLFLKNTKKSEVIGYGASTKGNVILNYSGISNKDLSLICDANPTKIGKLTPGSYIPIISKKKMRKIKPKYLLVLIWSFKNEVIRQEKKFIKNGGKLLFPLPVFHVVDKENYLDYLKQNLNVLSSN